MRVEWALVVRRFEEDEHGVNLLGAGADTTLVQGDPPWNFPITVAYSLVGTYEELRQDSVVTVTYAIIGPDLRPTMQPESEKLQVLQPEALHTALRPGSEGRMIRAATLPLNAKEEGAFDVSVRLDDQPPVLVAYGVTRVPVP